MLPQPWCMRSLLVGLTIVTVSSIVWVRPVSSLYRTCSTPQLESYCVSGSSTTSPLTFEIDYIGCPFSRELNTKCVCWCTSLHQAAPRWTVLTGVWISQSWSPPFSCSGDLALAVPRSRTTRYGQRCFAVSGPTPWNSLPLSVRDPSLTLTQFSARL